MTSKKSPQGPGGAAGNRCVALRWAA